MRDDKCTLEIRFRFRCITIRQLQRNFAGSSTDFSLAPPLLSRFHYRDCLVNAAPSVIKLPKVRMRSRCNGANNVDDVDRNALSPKVAIWTASEALPVNAKMYPRANIPKAFQNNEPSHLPKRGVHPTTRLLLGNLHTGYGGMTHGTAHTST